MDDNRNYLMAIALSIVVLVAWQFFVAGPKIEAQRDRAAVEAQQTTDGMDGAQAPTAPKPAATETTAAPNAPTPTSPAPAASAPAGAEPAPLPREAVLASNARVAIDTPSLFGSINLKGGRVDDISLKKYRDTVNPKSANIVLLSPAGSAAAYYADYGWVADPGSGISVPTSDTEWSVESGDKLAPGASVVLAWDNGAGLKFRRKLSIDDKYMLTIEQTVENGGEAEVTLYPYGLISRAGTPKTTG
ncbi:MAG: membrane protein insertase YidC, partial [Hyphomicrobiales bacterium]|nr:membrane protein insertase YidC [Hyphomicrobiales bacterium]